MGYEGSPFYGGGGGVSRKGKDEDAKWGCIKELAGWCRLRSWKANLSSAETQLSSFGQITPFIYLSFFPLLIPPAEAAKRATALPRVVGCDFCLVELPMLLAHHNKRWLLAKKLILPTTHYKTGISVCLALASQNPYWVNFFSPLLSWSVEIGASKRDVHRWNNKDGVFGWTQGFPLTLKFRLGRLLLHGYLTHGWFWCGRPCLPQTLINPLLLSTLELISLKHSTAFDWF